MVSNCSFVYLLKNSKMKEFKLKLNFNLLKIYKYHTSYAFYNVKTC